MKAFKVKIYPNKTQQLMIDGNFGCARFIYNKMIEINQKKYHRTGKSLSGYDMQAYLPKLKKQYPFLKEVNSQSLQIVCHNLAEAYSRFFQKKSGYPSFKKRGVGDSFSVITNCKLLDNEIKLPKVKKVKFRGGCRPTGKVKRFVVSKDATGYYCSILFDEGKKEIALEKVNNLVGVDVGIKDFAICSNKVIIKNPRYTEEFERKLKKAQQSLSRKQKGSKKRAQAKTRVAKIHKKISNKRMDFAHKISRQIVNSCDNQTAIAIESLTISGMMKNHNLAKSIADCGWSQFGNFLKYKAADVGKQVIEVGRFYPSSKTCSSCGVVNSDLKLSDRKWTCEGCKSEHDRDFNASLNIAMEGARTLKAGSVLASGEDISLEIILKNIKESDLCEADNL